MRLAGVPSFVVVQESIIFEQPKPHPMAFDSREDELAIRRLAVAVILQGLHDLTYASEKSSAERWFFFEEESLRVWAKLAGLSVRLCAAQSKNSFETSRKPLHHVYRHRRKLMLDSLFCIYCNTYSMKLNHCS